MLVHDGLPSQAMLDVRDRASTLKLRAFSPGDESRTHEPDGDDPPAAAAKQVLAIGVGTAGDGVKNWLVAGQALMVLLLRGSIDGVRASPLGQVVDQPWSRRWLASELGCIGQPQMVLRVGYALPGPKAPRQPVGEISVDATRLIDRDVGPCRLIAFGRNLEVESLAGGVRT